MTLVRAYAVWVSAVLLLGLGACSGKSRSFGDGAAVADGTEGNMLLPGAAGAANAELARSPGAACVSSADCDAPTHCVDGVCCTSACTELCAACNVPGSVGSCSPAPSDAACGVLLCAGFDTECRKLDQAQLSLNCEAFGACKSQADCAVVSEPSGVTCQAGVGACDGSGACIVAGKAALGQACAAASECAEGHCVMPATGGPGICCDAACDGACQVCSPAGHCELTPASDDRCEAVTCPADDVCNDYTETLIASQCRGFGQCQTGRDCPSVPLRPAAECECDGITGTCLLRGGAACTAAGECASGICGTNGQGAPLCCAAACAVGEFCSADGSSCVGCDGGTIECDGNNELRCEAGAINAVECPNGCTPGIGCSGLPLLGFPCDASQCAAPNVCQPDVAGTARCCSRDCAAEGKLCSENGSCVCQAGQIAAGEDCLLQAGDPCLNSQECQPGLTCIDGVCCQEGCSGTCESCEPNTGLCVPTASGQQDALCSNGRQCNGARGDCRLTVRQQCSGTGTECTTNNCEYTVGNATQICCAQPCAGDRPFCRSDGNVCVQCETNADCGNGCNTFTGLCNALFPVGTPCGATAQCASGAQCLLDESGQTRCCEQNCAAIGLLCNGAGECVAPAPARLQTVVGGSPAAFARTLVGEAAAASRVWTVENGGAAATGFLTLNNSNPAEFQANGTCLNAVLQPGASCNLSITFAPAAPGTREGTLTLTGGQGIAISVGVQGEARLRDGEPCPGLVTLCDSSTCTEWFADPDTDGFGSSESVGGFPSVSVCGDASLENRPPPFIVEGGCRGVDAEIQYVLRNETPGLPNRGLDCCDRFFRCDSSGSTALTPDNAFPGQSVASSGAASCGSAPNAGLARDFNCDGEAVLVSSSVLPPISCEGRTQADCGRGAGRLSGEPDCAGALTYTAGGCAFSGGECAFNSNAGQVTAQCL